MWDTSPNLDGGWGVTLPRVNRLIRAHSTRRRREMQELASVMSHAWHKPEKLKELFKPTVAELARKSKKDPTAWDTDEWWQTES